MTLCTRNAKDRTAGFRAVADDVAGLAARTLLLDGEVVGFDPRQVSRFQLLQQGESALMYAVFDCLYVDGRDLRSTPLADLHRGFRPLVRRTPPFADPPRIGTAVWLHPALVAFHEWTADLKLRHPVFLGLRDDKSPRECRLPEAA